MLSEIRNIFFTYGPWIIIFPAFISLKNYRRNSAEVKIISYYLLLSVLALTASLWCWNKSINNMPINHLFTIFEFLILAWFYSKLLDGFISKRLIAVLTTTFVAFALIDSFYIEGLFNFNSLGRSVEALLLILLSFVWFVKLLNHEEPQDSQTSKGINLIVSGFLLYFSGSIILFSFSNNINEMVRSLSLNIWTIHTVLSVIMYLLISVGILNSQTK